MNVGTGHRIAPPTPSPEGAGLRAEGAGLGTSLSPKLFGARGFEENTQQTAHGFWPHHYGIGWQLRGLLQLFKRHSALGCDREPFKGDPAARAISRKFSDMGSRIQIEGGQLPSSSMH